MIKMKILQQIQNNSNITQEQKDIIVGTILGDASIVSNPSGTNAFMSFTQGDIHKAYLYHLFWMLSNLINSLEPTVRMQHDKRYNKINISHSFTLLSSTSLQLYAQLFLQKNRNR